MALNHSCSPNSPLKLPPLTLAHPRSLLRDLFAFEATANDVERLGTRANGLVANAFGLLVMGVASMLGLTALARVIATVSGMALPAPGLMLPAFALIGVFAGRAVTRRALR